MNTKQLWQALTSNPITEPYFDGIFSVDTLKEIKTKPELIICNTNPSYKSGKHCLLFFFRNNTVNYYDSLGYDLDHYGEELTEFVKKFVKFYQSSKVRTQPKNSSLCGYYCLYLTFKMACYKTYGVWGQARPTVTGKIVLRIGGNSLVTSI